MSKKTIYPIKIVTLTDPYGNMFTSPTIDYGPDRNGCEKISRNCYKGSPVHSMEQLIALAHKQKAVLVDNGPGWKKISAANWVARQPAERVYDYLRHGVLFHIVKEEDFL